jgi:NAD(P)-dependent dehydrogenase (short-subunit alcohol dehydrogenase family)
MGTFICAQAAAKEMIKRNVTGSMVFVASMSAHGSNKVSKIQKQNLKFGIEVNRVANNLLKPSGS